MEGRVKPGYVLFFSNFCCCTSFFQDPPTSWHCNSESVAYVCRIEGLVSILDVEGSAFSGTKWRQGIPGKYRIFESDDLNLINIYVYTYTYLIIIYIFYIQRILEAFFHWLAMV